MGFGGLECLWRSAVPDFSGVPNPECSSTNMGKSLPSIVAFSMSGHVVSQSLKVENGAKRSGWGTFLREYGLVSLWQLCPSGLDGKLLQSALAPAI